MKTIALYNIKGGVGKTTSAVNLAYLAAASGLQTALWDLDPQGCAGWYLGVEDEALSRRASRLIEGKLALDELRIDTPYDNLSLVPGDLSLRALDVQLQQQGARKSFLKSLLKQFGKEQELVVFDCAPALSSVAEQLFHAVDILLVPLIPTPLSLRAYEQLREFTDRKQWADLQIIPFFTQVDRRRKVHNEIVEKRRKLFPEMLKSYIPYSSSAEQMGTHRAPVAAFAGSSPAGLAYWLLWGELKKKLK